MKNDQKHQTKLVWMSPKKISSFLFPKRWQSWEFRSHSCYINFLVNILGSQMASWSI